LLNVLILNLSIRNWPCGTTCVMCSLILQEDADHLFLYCAYARRVWNDILPANLTTPTCISMLSLFLHQAEQRHNKLSQFVSAACWNLWKERNRRIFSEYKQTNRKAAYRYPRTTHSGLTFNPLFPSLCTYPPYLMKIK
jgi:hypothetical protein